jgi:cellulose synthase/poly-beta-1,6-N-acetylglucosamine synthase-like glycosyltransferase
MIGNNFRSMTDNNTNRTEKFTLHSEAIFKSWDYPLFIILTGLIWSAIIYFGSYWCSLGDWSYLVALDYPHDTWVLDEGDDPEVKELCQRLGAHHFSRKNLARYQTETGRFKARSKHGNYNAWLHEIGFDQYDIITAFDPDHVPEPTFLSEVLGYFENPKVGYVQAAQVYYNQRASLIARGAAEETYAYYSSIQMAYYGLGYSIVNGCHSSHRVTALKQVGGFAPHDADDLLITLLYQASGWEGVYVPKILVRGLTPVDWEGYLTQQRRWARSVLDVKFRIHPKLRKNLSFRKRAISFLHGATYIQDSIINFLGLTVLIFMLATSVTPNALTHLNVPRLAILFGVLQLCNFYRQRFHLDWRKEWGVYWRARIVEFAKWPYIIAAFCEVLLGRRVPYALTRKTKTKKRRRMSLWPHLIVACLILSAWIIGIFTAPHTHPILHIWAAVVVCCSLALIATDFMNFPDPYDKALFPNAPRETRPLRKQLEVR